MADSATSQILIPATFGAAGTIIGALISRASAQSQRRSDKDDQVRVAAVAFSMALEDLEANPTIDTVRSARYALMRLGFAAVAAGIDSGFALGLVKDAGQLMRLYPELQGKRREQIAQKVSGYAAALVAAVKLPYWRRRGRFMDPDMKERLKVIEMQEQSLGRFR